MPPPRSRRHGLIVIGTLFLTLGLLYGIWYSYSVFLVALIEHFGWSRSVTAGAMSVFILSHGIFGPFAGRLVEVFGPRRLMMTGSVVMAVGLLLTSQVNQWWQLYLSFGVVSALGLAACGWVPSVILTEKWFPDKVGTALGFVTAGIGVGILSIVPLSNVLIESYDWRLAFQVLAALVVLIILPAAFFILREPPPAEAPGSKRQGRALVGEGGAAIPSKPSYGWTVATAVRSRSFRFAVLAFFAGGCLSQLLIMHQFAFMVDHGVAKTMGSVIVGVIGITSIPGKMMWGALSDRVGRELAFTGGLIFILFSVGALALVGIVPGLLMPFAFAVLVGVGYSVNAPIIPAVARDLFAGPRFPSIFGTLSMFSALGGATGSWLGGALYDWTGDYQWMLMVAAGLTLVAPLMLWFAAPRKPETPPEL
ncbi:MAG: MFS transporter [Porticoccaceae bacterium]|nr:MFS transporter [Porticoccaceae bacterium]